MQTFFKCLILSIVLAPKFFIYGTDQATHKTEKRTFSLPLPNLQMYCRIKWSSLTSYQYVLHSEQTLLTE